MNIIFDLDGTLINSAPGVLGSLSYVMKKHQIDDPAALSPDLIGPPLREILIKISRSSGFVDLALMEQTFKTHYDETGVFETTQYDGVTQMLADLNAGGHSLFIATNKRAIPTGLLVKYFSWDKYFGGTYSLDSFDPPVKDKAALLERVINTHLLLKNETIYIGDRPEDYDAANKCDINFMHATWGYGGVDHALGMILGAPNEIRDRLPIN
ncbi:HAD hydrolase-like protein [Polynucleobacter paneuropaeus]|nr:HAD hydrolase-like protein [Polynucleobacter paneuropaeus]